MVGEVVGHAVGGVDKVIAEEDGEEFGAGHEARVTTDGTEDTQEFGALAVFGRGDILEIIGTAIAPVTVEMVDLMSVRTRTYPRERHERVAVHTVKMPHDRVLSPADAV